jgi:hypothetical protein
VTLKGSNSRAQGAALGTDADYEMSPVRAAQAVSPLQGCSQLIRPDPRVSPWALLHRPFRAYILNLVPFMAVPETTWSLAARISKRQIPCESV